VIFLHFQVRNTNVHNSIKEHLNVKQEKKKAVQKGKQFAPIGT
jgi:hypothetical protein